ncbi:MAG: radical SAM protein [Deltaproteobacteria bacterium]|jgi:MoaA/NifB/PqqE/SkfB family radical SAM enzyme|nr:radical SAM protein [Deltaproteobacteria bacterium]
MSLEVIKLIKMTAKILAKGMIQANVMINYECNCRCRICDYWQEPYGTLPPMSIETAGIVTAKLRKLAPLSMCLVGGEPLLHPQLTDLAGPLARDHFLDLVTNGWYMTADLAKELFGLGLYEIAVSLDYSEPAAHDAQRGRKGVFERAVAALEHLAGNRRRKDQRVRLISVVMDDNLDHLEKLSLMCQKLGVFHSLTLCYCGRGCGQPPADMTEAVKWLREIETRRPELLILPGYLDGFLGRSQCRNGLNLMAVDPQGQLLRCIDRQERPLGSLLEEDLEVLLDRMRKAAQSEPCDDCWTSCRGVVEPLLYGPSRLRNWLAHIRFLRADQAKGRCGWWSRAIDREPG